MTRTQVLQEIRRMRELLAGWPRAVAYPRLPQFRTCPTHALDKAWKSPPDTRLPITTPEALGASTHLRDSLDPSNQGGGEGVSFARRSGVKFERRLTHGVQNDLSLLHHPMTERFQTSGREIRLQVVGLGNQINNTRTATRR